MSDDELSVYFRVTVLLFVCLYFCFYIWDTDGDCAGLFLYTLINFRVTRTLFVFAELTNLDPNYNGPSFNFDTIIRELIDQVEVGRLIYVNMAQLLGHKALHALNWTKRNPPLLLDIT